VVLLLIQSFRLVQRHQLSMGAVKLGAGGLTSIDGRMMAGSKAFQPNEQRPGYSSLGMTGRRRLTVAVGGLDTHWRETLLGAFGPCYAVMVPPTMSGS
jgi:hypothetical protein